MDQIDGDGCYFSEIYRSGSGDGYDEDEEEGHGTHTAGTAAGAILSDFKQSDCARYAERGCVGRCIASISASDAANNDLFDIDTFCPAYAFDGNSSSAQDFLSDNSTLNLYDNHGVVPGAKLSIIDVSHGGQLWGTFAGNGPWSVTSGTGLDCTPTPEARSTTFARSSTII